MKTLFLPLLALLALAGCKAHERSPAYVSSYASDRFLDDDKKKSKTAQPEERIMIYNASLTLQVRNSDSTNSRLSRIAAKYEGYVLSMGTSQSVIRVKAAFLGQAMNEICTGGQLSKKNIYGEDVTNEYMDSKIRLENSLKARQRYLELLAKAENVEAALKVEKELERLNNEIDVLEGRLKRLQHLSEYSTITVSMEKKAKPGILGYVFVGLYKGVKWLFIRN